jgi:hypothetical protein
MSCVRSSISEIPGEYLNKVMSEFNRKKVCRNKARMLQDAAYKKRIFSSAAIVKMDETFNYSFQQIKCLSGEEKIGSSGEPELRVT